MNGKSERELSDYMNLDFGDEGIDASVDSVSDVQIHVANIQTNQDLLDVKDALYAGDIVIANVESPSESLTTERAVQRLEVVSQDVEGDIARKSGGEVIISPSDVGISRSQIGT